MKKLFFLFTLAICTYQVTAQTYEQRKQQYVDSVVANNYEDAIMIQAFLNQPVNQDRLDTIYSEFGVRSTIDFRLVELVRVMYLTDGSYDSQILAAMETLPFWINDGDTLHNYWTENHMIMWMSCEWLMHERHSWQITPQLRQRLLHYLNLKLDAGFYEYFSSTYFPYTVSGLMNLADFAEDDEIRTKAEAVARKLLSGLLLMTNTEGAFYPAAGRNYASKYDSVYGNTHNAIIYLISGRGPCPSKNASRADFLVTSQIDFSDIEDDFVSKLDTIVSFGHTPEEARYRHDSLYYVDELMMLWSSGMYFHPYIAETSGQLLLDSSFWGHVDFTDLAVISSFPPEDYQSLAIDFDELTVSRTDCGASIAVYKDEETVLTSIQDYWKGKIGFQQWPIAANVGGTAVYTASGQVAPNWGDRNSSNFNEHLPYIDQQSNVALVMYRPQAVSPFLPYNNKDVALHWIDSAFSDIQESGNWLFGNRNENYIAVRRACVGEINQVRACETNGGQTWVFIVGNDNTYDNFSSFQGVVNQSIFEEQWTTDVDGDSTYYASITFEGNTIDYSWGPEPPFTSIEEIYDNDLVIFPNPSNGLFTVEASYKEPFRDANVKVYSYTGRLVRANQTMQGSTITINLQNEPAGIYFLMVDNGQSILTKRLVVSP